MDDDRRTNKNTIESEPSNARIPVKMQIHLFFPKLGKVKALPYSGTGKHKYSFRRIEVPSSLPINFWDCEEHSGASKSVKHSGASRKQVPTNSSNIEETTPTEPNGNGDVQPHLKEPNGLKRAKSTKQQASIHQSEDFSVRGKSSSRELVSEKENSSLNKSNIVQSTPLKDLPKSNDLSAVEHHANENIVECSKLLGIGEKENLPSHFTDGSIQATSGTPPKDSAGPRSIDPSEFKDHNKRKPVGQAWMQKSSWRELVGGVGSSSFSDACLGKKVNLWTTNDACLGKNGNLCSKSNSHDVPNIETSAVTGLGDSQLHETTERNSQNEKVDTFSNGTLSRNENHKVSDKRLLAGPEIGASRTFMRSAASEKDWIKTRAALRGGLKKKSSDKKMWKDILEQGLAALNIEGRLELCIQWNSIQCVLGLK
ncbi:hypothetical protein Syun_021473 [Stephania yunnanensis]|uniref:Uncharacterized protein n=1 Tax=Stephania yunnanensis TaxID=152371 RepID=A0AAP0IH50_9MAGN